MSLCKPTEGEWRLVVQGSVGYNLVFAACVCLACAVVVSSSNVVLADLQARNVFLDKQRNVLLVAGLANEEERLTPNEIELRFAPIQPVILDLGTGEVVDGLDPEDFDQRLATNDQTRSRVAPDNRAGVARVPELALVYEIRGDGGQLELVVLPIEGLGLWGTLYGFVALDGDLRTIRGLTFYEHKETPGLGGEVDNPRWKALWPGRLAFNDELVPVVRVVKGVAGSLTDDPYAVDGLSGATITSRGVTNLLQFWLGFNGFEPYLMRLRQSMAMGAD